MVTAHISFAWRDQSIAYLTLEWDNMTRLTVLGKKKKVVCDKSFQKPVFLKTEQIIKIALINPVRMLP